MADEERRGYKRLTESSAQNEQELSLRHFSNKLNFLLKYDSTDSTRKSRTELTGWQWGVNRQQGKESIQWCEFTTLLLNVLLQENVWVTKLFLPIRIPSRFWKATHGDAGLSIANTRFSWTDTRIVSYYTRLHLITTCFELFWSSSSDLSFQQRFWW
jgi:hypothetical protein